MDRFSVQYLNGHSSCQCCTRPVQSGFLMVDHFGHVTSPSIQKLDYNTQFSNGWIHRHSKTGHFYLVFEWFGSTDINNHLKNRSFLSGFGRVNHVEHSKTGHEKVQYSDESDIQVSNFPMPTVFKCHLNTGLNLVWNSDHHLNTVHLNTRKVKFCYSDVFIIQIPTV